MATEYLFLPKILAQVRIHVTFPVSDTDVPESQYTVVMVILSFGHRASLNTRIIQFQ